MKAARILRFKAWGNLQQERMMESYRQNPLSPVYKRIERRLRSFPRKIKGERIEYQYIAGRKCGIIKPESNRSKACLVFLHGGSYLMGPTDYSWVFLHKISRITHMNAFQPDYPKAPEWTSAYTIDYMEAFFRELYRNFRPDQVVLAGSSAGGGLALATFFRLRARGLPLPSRMVLISPWVDLAMENPQTRQMEDEDITLSRDTLLKAAHFYCGGEDMKAPRHSPINGDFQDLPPTMLLTGSEEMFLEDCRKLKERMEAAGAAVEYIEQKGLFHSWPVVHQLPESSEVRVKIADFLKEKNL